MKSLLLIRHAKSSWDDILQSDFERPLNDRGKTEAPIMATRLIKKGVAIDAFVSSPAKRAKKTASIFIHEFGKEENEIDFIPSLYHATVNTFFNVVSELNDLYDTVAIFSHNPGITEFVNLLTTSKIDNMPTSGIFAVKAAIDSWKDFANAQKTFWFFDYPKSGLNL